MLQKLKDRRTFIWLIFAMLFIIMVFRLAHLTIVKGEHYTKKALEMRLKKVTQIAKRGEIYDTNGVLLAGNGTKLYLEYLYNHVEKEDFEKMVIKMFTLLEENGEKHIELPIIIKDGKFSYKSELDKEKWMKKRGFETHLSAREVFDSICEREYIDAELSDINKQRILILKGHYLPIGVGDTVEFLSDFEKKDFLKSYGIKEDKGAKYTFSKLRDHFDIDKNLSPKEAYYVLTMLHHIRKLGYLKYRPIEIAKEISKKTAILIEEQAVNFPNFSIGVSPYRIYPQKNDGAHLLGYMGPISSSYDLARYTFEKGYEKTDMVGKVGIESYFEDVLHGRRGVKFIEVDAVGKKTRDIANSIPNPNFKDSAPLAGKNIDLTIDIEFSKKVKASLQKMIKALNEGSKYESRFNEVKIDRRYPYARTAAAVVVDPENFEVKAMVSIPDYDINKFSGGISIDDWVELNESYWNDPLGPKPLYNIATMTAVQPGSIFKMITSFAALQEGLSPFLRINNKGVIKTDDGQIFGCWVYNMFRGSHGFLNMKEAIALSCNYYFYCIGSGYNYGNNTKFNFEMNADKIVEAAKLFGLDEKSGVEIGESIRGVPNPQQKKEFYLYSLKEELKSLSKKYFDREIYENTAIMEEKIKKVNELGVENPNISRASLIEFLEELFKISDRKKSEDLADIIKFNFFEQMKTFESDPFNLSIGQGGHSYTPTQIARYISTIANGGFLQKLTLVKKIDGKPSPRDPHKHIDPNSNIKYVQEGMLAAAKSASYNHLFEKFPVDVAIKTGTAENEGTQYMGDEESYIRKYLSSISKNSIEEVEEKAREILIKRSLMLADLNEKIRKEEDENKKRELQREYNSYNSKYFLNKGNAMREAIFQLSGNTISSKDFDKFKSEYDDFTWLVAYAPYDKPKVVVVVFIPQGGKGSYGIPVANEIIGDYLKLDPKE